jgi:hypothetical protein
MISNTPLEGLRKQIEEYSKVSLEYVKWMSIQKSSKLLSTLAVLMLILFGAILALLFMTIGFAYWLGTYLGSTYLGFIIVAIFFILITLLIILSKNRFIQKPLHNYLIRQFQKI